MSSFGWLDYSEHERRRTLDVVELFREKDTRDELGIGSVRDAFADLLFPGTSTIQTRARYFLFISWIYIKLESTRLKGVPWFVRLSLIRVRERDTWLASRSLEGHGVTVRGD